MKKQNSIIHIKLDSEEAVQSRKDILNTEIDLIKIAQGMKSYRALRLQELQLKIELQKKLRSINLNMLKIKKLLPKIKIPKILKKHEEDLQKEVVIKELSPKEEGEGIVTPKKKTKKVVKKPKAKQKADPMINSLENQLKDIQSKLSSIE